MVFGGFPVMRGAFPSPLLVDCQEAAASFSWVVLLEGLNTKNA